MVAVPVVHVCLRLFSVFILFFYYYISDSVQKGVLPPISGIIYHLGSIIYISTTKACIVSFNAQCSSLWKQITRAIKTVLYVGFYKWKPYFLSLNVIFFCLVLAHWSSFI